MIASGERPDRFDIERMAATPLEVRTLSDRLMEVVRDMILSGSIEADVPIRQDSLAAELNVSKIPLREALVRLEQDGLVDRREFPVVPPHVEYSLTPMGDEVVVHVRGLADWIELNLHRILAGRDAAA